MTVGWETGWDSLVAQAVKRLPAMRETQVRSPGREDPLEKEMAPTPVLLPKKFHGWRRLVGYSPWGRKESDTTERLYSLYCLLPANNNNFEKLTQYKDL